MSYVFQMQKQANVPQYSLHSIALQNYRNRNANGYIYIYIHMFILSQQSKSYMCSSQGNVLCFNIDFKSGFTCSEGTSKVKYFLCYTINSSWDCSLSVWFSILIHYGLFLIRLGFCCIWRCILNNSEVDTTLYFREWYAIV